MMMCHSSHQEHQDMSWCQCHIPAPISVVEHCSIGNQNIKPGLFCSGRLHTERTPGLLLWSESTHWQPKRLHRMQVGVTSESLLDFCCKVQVAEDCRFTLLTWSPVVLQVFTSCCNLTNISIAASTIPRNGWSLGRQDPCIFLFGLLCSYGQTSRAYQTIYPGMTYLPWNDQTSWSIGN